MAWAQEARASRGSSAALSATQLCMHHAQRSRSQPAGWGGRLAAPHQRAAYPAGVQQAQVGAAQHHERAPGAGINELAIGRCHRHLAGRQAVGMQGTCLNLSRAPEPTQPRANCFHLRCCIQGRAATRRTWPAGPAASALLLMFPSAGHSNMVSAGAG